MQRIRALLLIRVSPLIRVLPLLTLLAIGLPMSVVGLRLTTNLGSRGWRWFGLIINGASIALYAAVIIGGGVLVISTTNRRFIVPEGYTGDVYIIYNAADGKPATTHQAGVTLRIPSSGILYTTAPMVGGLIRDEYYYERGDGTQRRIRESLEHDRSTDTGESGERQRHRNIFSALRHNCRFERVHP